MKVCGWSVISSASMGQSKVKSQKSKVKSLEKTDAPVNFKDGKNEREKTQ